MLCGHKIGGKMNKTDNTSVFNMPFQKEILDSIFCFDRDGCIIENESFDLEFKKSFGFKHLDDIFKTMNGLANREGGYIVCGVEPSSKK